jgi:hypothetical protein
MTKTQTADYRAGVREDLKHDPLFRREILGEALEVLLGGEVTLAREILRDYINAQITFPKLAAGTKIHVKTLHQMFGPKGNPTAKNLFAIISFLQRTEGIRFEVRPVPVRAKREKRSSARTKRAA